MVKQYYQPTFHYAAIVMEVLRIWWSSGSMSGLNEFFQTTNLRVNNGWWTATIGHSHLSHLHTPPTSIRCLAFIHHFLLYTHSLALIMPLPFFFYFVRTSTPSLVQSPSWPSLLCPSELTICILLSCTYVNYVIAQDVVLPLHTTKTVPWTHFKWQASTAL